MMRRLCVMCAVAVLFLTCLMLWNEFGSVRRTVVYRKRGRIRELRPGKMTVIGGKSLASHAVYDQVQTFVVFIGYPRSGHTLISSLIDAHPNAIIANEFDIIGRWLNWKPEQRNKYFLFDQLYKNSRAEAKKGFRSYRQNALFKYHVKGQYQGSVNGTLKVIGAKKAGKTTNQLSKDKRSEILDVIMKAVNVKFKFLHVVRNPFDNIATMLLRAKKMRQTIKKNGKKVNDTVGLEKQIIKYFDLAAKNQLLAAKYKKNLLVIQSLDLIKKPKETLREVCKFLNLSCNQKYLQDCAKIVYKQPSKTRHNVVWTSAQKRRILATLKRYPFLRGFTFYS